MPYALKNRCVIRSDTGAIVKCHRTRARALRHLAALQINVPEVKAQAADNPSGRTPMSRADAARHAALVRWKKETPLAPQTGGMANPKIAARVKEILAERAAKGKKKTKGGKAKGKGKAAKPKDARTPQEKANQNRAQVAKQSGLDKLEGTIVRLNAGMQGAGMENDKHDELIKRGLAERHADGTVTLSASGKKWKAAADKGDVEAAGGALAEAQAHVSDTAAKEKVKAERETARQAKQAEREKAKTERIKKAAEKKQAAEKKRGQNARARKKVQREPSAKETVQDAIASMRKSTKAIDMTNLAIKAGARHSRTDMQHIQAIHDSAVACGADCATDDEEPGDDEMDMGEAEKAIKGIMDNPIYYAQHECSDIMQASNALSTMAMLISSELAEEDEDTEHVDMLCDAADTLIEFIQAEINELRGAAKDAADDARMGPMKAIKTNQIDIPYDPSIRLDYSGKAIDKREDVNPKAGVAEYGNVAFADAKNKKYPIDTEEHIRAAWNYIAKEANAAKYDPDEVAQIKSKIIAAWKKKIDKAGPPSAGKAWGLEHLQGDAIKALDNDVIRGYAVRFGDADHADLQRDYYTKSTDFWLDHFGWPRPITYHHGMDAGTRNDPVIGHWLKAGVDDVGVWMEGQMDRAHAYYKAMKELAQRGYLRLSSDSAPQWVIREKQQNGVNEIKRWPLVTSSVTVTPMEPRMLPVEVKAYLAEIGLDIDADAQVDDPDLARSDATKASDEDRARAIMLELDLLELETA